jgi:splicing factor 3B subunit 3
VRHIRQGGAQKEWTTPHQKVIEKASANARQLAVSLAGGDVVYFELDATGALVELGQKELGVEIACLDVGPLPPGRARSPFMAVGCCDDSARLLSLDPGDDLLAQASRQQLAARPSSIRLAVMRAEGAAAASEADAANGDDASSAALYLHVGLATGVSQRATVDAVSGDLSDVRARFLGARPVKLFRVPIAGANAVLALSSQPWLSYAHGGRHLTTPLTYDALEYAAPFASAQCPEGVVAIAGSSLRIFTVDELGGLFNGASYPLR